MRRRVFLVEVAVLTAWVMLTLSLVMEMYGQPLSEAALRQSQTILTAGQAEGTIYDRELKPLVNQGTLWYAAVTPTPEAVAALLPHTLEMSPLVEGLRRREPFLCRTDGTTDCPDIVMLSVPERRSGRTPAQHLLGYTLEGHGVTGLESAYDRILRGTADKVSVTYTVDARGSVLPGQPPVIREAAGSNPGLVTTLDSRIQALCEALPLEKGAVVVMEVQTGDVLGMASFPAYDPDQMAQALEDPDSPLIDRCLCAYSVGSIFKLVTAAAAYREGLCGFRTTCTGKTSVHGQQFRCHDWRGHGELDLRQAMIYSCNAYFVELSERLDPAVMRETAQDLGFGTQIALSSGNISASGTLPSAEDLRLPAEMANFCFGQGLLTATPLQITQMTCGIANDGKMPLARLIRGFSTDGETIADEKSPLYAAALPEQTAQYLQSLLYSAVNENEASNARSEAVTVCAKTSTAQTGRYDADDTELCHAWITGYFPAEAPRYAVTVLAEDGGYGNDAAAPLFRELAEGIMGQ